VLKAKSYLFELDKSKNVLNKTNAIILSPFDYDQFIKNKTIKESIKKEKSIVISTEPQGGSQFDIWEEVEITGTKLELDRLYVKIMIHSS
jgi:hypothetical protein